MPLKPRTILNAAIAVAILAAVGVLAHLHVASQTYYPVVKLSSPEGLTLTMVQDPVSERRACGEANGRFLAPLRSGCKKCAVVYARCERELEGVEFALLNSQPVPHHQVLADGMRLMVEGSKQIERDACESIAVDIVKMGIASAACVFPRK